MRLMSVKNLCLAGTLLLALTSVTASAAEEGEEGTLKINPAKDITITSNATTNTIKTSSSASPTAGRSAATSASRCSAA